MVESGFILGREEFRELTPGVAAAPFTGDSMCLGGAEGGSLSPRLEPGGVVCRDNSSKYKSEGYSLPEGKRICTVIIVYYIAIFGGKRARHRCGLYLRKRLGDVQEITCYISVTDVTRDYNS